MEPNDPWKFDWGTIKGEVHPLGAMLGPVYFTLADGRKVQPFAVAPWVNDSEDRLFSLAAILQNLRGEWPCIPFGQPNPHGALPDVWLRSANKDKRSVDPFVHGYGSNHPWRLVELNDQEIIVAIDYPDDHPIARLKRRITRAEGPGLSLEIEVVTRRNCRLPIGIHPVFALNGVAESYRLTIPSLNSLRSYPVPIEPDISLIDPDRVFDSLQDVESRSGKLNLSQLPLKEKTEELLSVELDEGYVTLEDLESHFQIELRWRTEDFPRCLLWLSNRGRSSYPWNGRFSAIGIEPVRSVFDLGERYCSSPLSPLSDEVHKGFYAFKANTSVSFAYQICVSST